MTGPMNRGSAELPERRAEPALALARIEEPRAGGAHRLAKRRRGRRRAPHRVRVAGRALARGDRGGVAGLPSGAGRRARGTAEGALVRGGPRDDAGSRAHRLRARRDRLLPGQGPSHDPHRWARRHLARRLGHAGAMAHRGASDRPDHARWAGRPAGSARWLSPLVVLFAARGHALRCDAHSAWRDALSSARGRCRYRAPRYAPAAPRFETCARANPDRPSGAHGPPPRARRCRTLRGRRRRHHRRSGRRVDPAGLAARPTRPSSTPIASLDDGCRHEGRCGRCVRGGLGARRRRRCPRCERRRPARACGDCAGRGARSSGSRAPVRGAESGRGRRRGQRRPVGRAPGAGSCRVRKGARPREAGVAPRASRARARNVERGNARGGECLRRDGERRTRARPGGAYLFRSHGPRRSQPAAFPCTRRCWSWAPCASGALAVGLATRWLGRGACDLVLAGGFDDVTVFVAAGFEALRATSASIPPRPFRVERDGMALGEGAGIIALVSAEKHPTARRLRHRLRRLARTACTSRRPTGPGPASRARRRRPSRRQAGPGWTSSARTRRPPHSTTLPNGGRWSQPWVSSKHARLSFIHSRRSSGTPSARRARSSYSLPLRRSPGVSCLPRRAAGPSITTRRRTSSK